MNRAGKSIVLIGMMGAGKSSVGRCLQRKTSLARFDIDELISSKFGKPIPNIFADDGEEAFRSAETSALRELSSTSAGIVVTGGGIVLRDENVDLLKQLGIVVWLEANEETLFERASRRGGRPLLDAENPRERLSILLKARAPLYTKAADIRVDTTTLTQDEVADFILDETKKRTATDE